MLTPYDWQEGIGNRIQYIENKLVQGVPVLAVSLSEGILVLTYRRQTRKIYEIYDRLIFAAIGQQSDVEAVRTAAVDFAHQEGYARSEQDVTIQRVATALSSSIKKAFSDFSTSPFVAKVLFAEVGDKASEDVYYSLSYDGDFAPSRKVGVLAGTDEMEERLRSMLKDVKASTKADEAVKRLQEIWKSGQETEDESSSDPAKGLNPEAVLLERSADRENRFRVLFPEDL